jgi:diguanylate cyclase (GGDEF)-like protein
MASSLSKNPLPFGLDLVVAGLWVAIVVAFSVMGVVFTTTSNKEFASMEQRTATLAHMIAEHAEFQFERADLLLLEVIDDLSYEDMNTSVSEKRREEIETSLFVHWRRLENIASFSIIGADGIRRYGVVNKNFTDLSGRGYFTELRDGKKDFYISMGEDGLASGKSGVHVARRKLTKDGKFAGVIVMNLPLFDVFYNYYADLKLPTTSVISLRDRDRVLIRFPEAGTTNDTHHVVSDLVASGSKRGALICVSTFDGVERMIGYEEFGSSGMYVVVGESVAATMAGVRSDGWMMLFSGILAFIAAIIATSKVYQLRKSEERANFAAQHDILTELSNRAYLVKNFDSLIKKVLARGDTLSVIFMDLDNFKAVNDTVGHAAGDQLLINLSKRLATVIGEEDELIRLGGDEFIIIHIVRGKFPKHSTEELCWKLINSFSDTFKVNGRNHTASASIGAALAPQHGTSLDDLCRCADIAMYRGKAFGKGVYTIYSEGIESLLVKDGTLRVEELRDALVNNRFFLNYQPIIDLATGRVSSVEVLLRWKKADGTVVPASAFMELMERYSLIVDVGAFILDEACAAMARWKKQGLPPLSLSINLSPIQLIEGDLAAVFSEAIKTHGISSSEIKFELTERALMIDEQRVGERIRQISALGAEFQLDDFGVGYASLSYLSKYPIRTVKIDGSLARTVPERNKQLLAGILSMAKAMSLRTIVEGIESVDTLNAFKALGCDEAQGYIFTAPLTEDGFVDFVRELK